VRCYAVGTFAVGLTIAVVSVGGQDQAQVAPLRGSGPVCRNTRLSKGDFSALSRAWRTSRRLSAHLRLVATKHSSFAGQCGSTGWAYANFEALKGQHISHEDQMRLQDGPDVFERRIGGRWRDISDTGGDVPCGGPVGLPRPLVRIWGLKCR
jgi:hypothetical protein